MAKKSKFSGKSKSNDLPSRAKGTKPKPGQSDKEYAENHLDSHHAGRENWDKEPKDRGQGSEYSVLKKNGN